MRSLKYILLVLAISGLAGILLFSVLYVMGKISFTNYTWWLIISSLVWFAAILTKNRVARSETGK